MDSQVLITQQWLNSNYGGYSDFPSVTEDGITGAATFKALVWALQLEIGVSTRDGIFGNDTLKKCPTLRESSNPDEESPSNLIYILQGSLWCKGISPGGFTGIFGPLTASAISKFQLDAGISNDKVVYPYVLQGIMNTDAYSFNETDDIYDTYRHQVQLGLNKYYGAQIGLVAPNGIWERKSQTNLIKAVQLEWGETVDGIFGDGTLSKAPMLSKNTTGYLNSKRLLQWCLTINGFYPGEFDGIFGNDTYQALYDFQAFLCLGADGICGMQSWASLLSSRGSSSRTATALDTSKKINATIADMLYDAGYRDIGRYLTNASSGNFDKKMTVEEVNIIKNAGLSIFPIFQTYGNRASYFSAYQGIVDAVDAQTAAKEFGFPPSATIYFCVDYDVLMADVENNIVPYFKSIKERIGKNFKIGAYGPRYICSKLSELHLTSSSFVCDMSSGFTCNIGQKMPDNWAYDQFTEIYDANSEFLEMGYDKCIASPRRTATSPSQFITYQDSDIPELSSDKLLVFKQLYDLAYEYLESISVPMAGVIPTVYDANRIVLAYLRQVNNSYSSDAWTIIAGPIENAFNDLIKERYPNLVGTDITLTDPISNKNIEIDHFAATLGSLIYYVAVVDSFLDPYVDAFAGWAGDLMQVGGTLGTSMEIGGQNYFTNLDVLRKCIGTLDGELDSVDIYYKDDDNNTKIKHSAGFDYIDLVQDIDAFNIAKDYDFSNLPIYSILDDYYNISKCAETRYSNFERNLLDEFGTSSLYETASLFTQLQKLPTKAMNLYFKDQFGSFDNEAYGAYLANGFALKILYLKNQE